MTRQCLCKPHSASLFACSQVAIKYLVILDPDSSIPHALFVRWSDRIWLFSTTVDTACSHTQFLNLNFFTHCLLHSWVFVECREGGQYWLVRTLTERVVTAGLACVHWFPRAPQVCSLALAQSLISLTRFRWGCLNQPSTPLTPPL